MDLIAWQKRLRSFQETVANEEHGGDQRSSRCQRNYPRGITVSFKSFVVSTEHFFSVTFFLGMLKNLFRKYKPNFRKRNVDLTKIPELNENGESNTLPPEAKDDNSDRKFLVY